MAIRIIINNEQGSVRTLRYISRIRPKQSQGLYIPAADPATNRYGRISTVRNSFEYRLCAPYIIIITMVVSAAATQRVHAQIIVYSASIFHRPHDLFSQLAYFRSSPACHFGRYDERLAIVRRRYTASRFVLLSFCIFYRHIMSTSPLTFTQVLCARGAKRLTRRLTCM